MLLGKKLSCKNLLVDLPFLNFLFHSNLHLLICLLLLLDILKCRIWDLKRILKRWLEEIFLFDKLKVQVGLLVLVPGWSMLILRSLQTLDVLGLLVHLHVAKLYSVAETSDLLHFCFFLFVFSVLRISFDHLIEPIIVGIVQLNQIIPFSIISRIELWVRKWIFAVSLYEQLLKKLISWGVSFA